MSWYSRLKDLFGAKVNAKLTAAENEQNVELARLKHKQFTEQIQEATKRFNDYAGRLDTRKTQLAKVEKEYNQLSVTLNNALAANEATPGKISEDQLNLIAEEMASKSEIIENLRADISSDETEVKQYEANITHLRKQVAEQAREIDRMAVNNDMTKALNTAATAIDSISSENSALSRLSEENTNRINAAKRNYATANQESSKKQAIAELQSKLGGNNAADILAKAKASRQGEKVEGQ